MVESTIAKNAQKVPSGTSLKDKLDNLDKWITEAYVQN